MNTVFNLCKLLIDHEERLCMLELTTTATVAT